MTQNRRAFLGSMAAVTAASLLSHSNVRAHGQLADRLHISTSDYSWITFYKRQGRDWFADMNASFRELTKSGISGYVPSVKTPEQLSLLAPLLKKYKIEMRSLYVGCTLHTEKEAHQSQEQVKLIAAAAKPLGVKIMVINPNPIRWGGTEDKMDAQVELQAENLNRMGAELRNHGITLAYHNHDIEMRNAAREFHHMMVATDPAHVSLCLEAHWLYRGSGNSQIALFDIMRLYSSRIVEIHLRQSNNGIWSETFGEGDIDYSRLAKELFTLGSHPHLVLEQSVEKETPNTMDAVAAHKKDLQYASRVFALFNK